MIGGLPSPPDRTKKPRPPHLDRTRAVDPIPIGRVAQRESTSLTSRGSLVQSQSCPPSKPQGKPWGFVVSRPLPVVVEIPDFHEAFTNPGCLESLVVVFAANQAHLTPLWISTNDIRFAPFGRTVLSHHRSAFATGNAGYCLRGRRVRSKLSERNIRTRISGF